MGQTWYYLWDNLGQLTAVRDPKGQHTRYKRNTQGQVTAVTTPDGSKTRYEYDANGNCASVTTPDNQTEHYRYNELGLVCEHITADGRKTQYHYNGLSQVVKRTDSLGHALHYHYDGERNLIGLTNENGKRYQLKYDLNERLVEEIGFDGRTQRYQYNSLGHLTASEDISRDDTCLTRIRYQRDNQGRLLEQWQEIHNGEPTEQRLKHFSYDPAGRLTAANNDHRQLAWAYDAVGRVTEVHQDQHRIVHNYDPLGRRIGSQLPSGDQVDYQFDDGGLLTAIAFNQQTLAGFNYDELGRETERTFANNLVRQQSYDPQGRLQEQRLSKTQGEQQQTLNQRQYSYNARGQLSQIDDLRRGQTHYHYDAIDRLTEVQGPNPEQFIHDPAGNLLSQTGQPQQTGQISHNRLNFQGDCHYSYDQRGNRIQEARGKGQKLITTFEYDGLNQLTAVNNQGRTTQYHYDALGRRIAKISEQAKTEFLWNDDVLLKEQTIEGNQDSRQETQAKTYLFEPNSFKPLAQVIDQEIYYYHLDHLGTPLEITNAQGAIAWSASYRAYGNLALADVEQVENNLRFQGQYFDEETGLHYNRFRYYDPESGRFTQQDPIGLLGGINNYQYVPNPVTWVDPFGLTSKEVPGVCPKNLVAERKNTATEFYKSQGYAEENIPSHLTGIDFDKPVEVVTSKEGTPLYQFQSPGAPQGNYYALDPNITPFELGISPMGTNRALNQVQPKIKNSYIVAKDTPMLQSTAKSVDDFWSVKGQTFPDSDGGTQLFSGDKSSFGLVGD